MSTSTIEKKAKSKDKVKNDGPMTDGERAFAKRWTDNVTREELGAALDVRAAVVGEWEHDKREVPARARMRGKATNAQRIRIARRRSGWSLRRTAMELGLSHVTYLQHEQSGDKSLIEQWKKHKCFPA